MFVYLQWETSFETIKKCLFFHVFFIALLRSVSFTTFPSFLTAWNLPKNPWTFQVRKGGVRIGSGRSPRKATPRRSWSHVRNQRPWSWLQDDLRQDGFPVSDGWVDGDDPFNTTEPVDGFGYVTTVGGLYYDRLKKGKGILKKGDMKLDDLFCFYHFLPVSWCSFHTGSWKFQRWIW